MRADAEILAVVGQRVRRSVLKQSDWTDIADDTTLAGITYQLISDTTTNGSTGGNRTRRARLQLNLWSAKVDTLDTLYGYVTDKDKYNTWIGAGGDPEVSSVLTENGGDLPEINIPGRDKAMAVGRRIDFVLWYNAKPAA